MAIFSIICVVLGGFTLLGFLGSLKKVKMTSGSIRKTKIKESATALLIGVILLTIGHRQVLNLKNLDLSTQKN